MMYGMGLNHLASKGAAIKSKIKVEKVQSHTFHIKKYPSTKS